MKAVRVSKYGGPEVLSYDDVPVPEPGAGEALVKLAASGVNYIDIYFRTGLYPADPPFINGQEGAGVIESVGADVNDWKPGDRVAYTGIRGSYAEYAVVPANRLIPIPGGVAEKTAAALMLQGMTAHYLTHSTFTLKPGDTCLLHAAAGGVGLLLVQMAKMLGATVIGTCSTQEKAERIRAAGGDHVILYSEQDFEAEVKTITGGRGVDVVYDSVGQATWQGSLNSLRPRGMCVFFGNASGPVPPIAPLELTKRGSLFMTRPSLAAYVSTSEELQTRASDVLGWARDGKLNVHVGGEYPLADAGQAHIDLAARKTSGKLLLIP